MNTLLTSLVILSALALLFKYLNQTERFTQFVQGIPEYNSNASNYPNIKCDPDISKPCLGDQQIYTYVPYQSDPVKSKIKCPHNQLYNASYYPNKLNDKWLSNSLSGPYTRPLYKYQQLMPIPAFYNQTEMAYQ